MFWYPPRLETDFMKHHILLWISLLAVLDPKSAKSRPNSFGHPNKAKQYADIIVEQSLETGGTKGIVVTRDSCCFYIPWNVIDGA